MKILNIIILLVITVFFYRCIKVDQSAPNLNQNSNNFIKIKHVQNLFFEMKLLTLNELKQISKNHFSNSTNETEYCKNLSFIFKIKLKSSNNSNDIITGISTSIEDYKKNIEKMSLGLTEYFELSYDNNLYNPQIITFENAANVSPFLTFLIVFPIKSDAVINKSIDLQFIDFIFNTGIHHFQFDSIV